MTCPTCDGPACLLGTLGSRTHFRCRDCGLDFSVQEKALCADEAVLVNLDEFCEHGRDKADCFTCGTLFSSRLSGRGER